MTEETKESYNNQSEDAGELGEGGGTILGYREISLGSHGALLEERLEVRRLRRRLGGRSRQQRVGPDCGARGGKEGDMEK